MYWAPCCGHLSTAERSPSVVHLLLSRERQPVHQQVSVLGDDGCCGEGRTAGEGRGQKPMGEDPSLDTVTFDKDAHCKYTGQEHSRKRELQVQRP